MEGLAEVVSDALGEDVEVASLRRLTGGASRETWSFSAGASRLILRRDPPEAPAGMAHEAAALRAAAAAGVPVPEVLAASDDPSVLGAPFVLMAHVDGETLAPRILRSEEFAAVRPQLAERCGEILARIHAMPVEAELEHRDVVADLGATLRGFEEVSPALELGMRWLERHRPAPVDPPVVVHGDFRNGNLIVDPDDGIRAVLDWELVHLGDPMQDLGWLCTRCWRFGGPGDVGGFGSREDLFRGYERVSGRPVDPDVVRWWELYGTVWWGAGCMVQARRHLTGGERSLELAAIGWRVHEQAYDTLLLLEEMAA